MATAQSYINRALRLVNVLESGETPDGDMSSEALTVLNDMLNLWSIDKLLIYQRQERTHTLVASTNSYTIGSGGTIDTTRPVRIESAFVRDSDNYDRPLEIVNKDDYDRIRLKSSEATFPDRLFYDPGFALGTIYLYPTPSAANTLHYVSWLPFTTFTNLSTDIDLPPGYSQLIVYSLAVLLATEYNTPLRPDIAETARETREKIEELNNRNDKQLSQFDSVFNHPTYRYYRDEY